jgi:hypothetical protein
MDRTAWEANGMPTADQLLGVTRDVGVLLSPVGAGVWLRRSRFVGSLAKQVTTSGWLRLMRKRGVSNEHQRRFLLDAARKAEGLERFQSSFTNEQQHAEEPPRPPSVAPSPLSQCRPIKQQPEVPRDSLRESIGQLDVDYSEDDGEDRERPSPARRGRSPNRRRARRSGSGG